MGTFLLLLLFLLLAIILVVLAVIRFLYHKTGLSALVDLLCGKVPANRRFGGQTAGDGGTAESAQRRTTTATGDVIIDRRDPQQAIRKIFDKDEGEYVDFSEEREE